MAQQAASPTLEDPMLEITSIFNRWSLRLFLLAACVATPFAILTGYFAPEPLQWSALLIVAVAWVVFVGWLGVAIYWRAFAPRRATDVFYLRSFKNDAQTWPIRVAIQEAIGSRWRLSGIRDPQRRSLGFWSKLAPIFVAMKYSTPKFMDLEAGDDWKRRLWHSLRESQLAIIDVSMVTTFVLDEIAIAHDSLSSQRILFLGHAPQTVEQVEALANQQLGPAAIQAHVVIWPAPAGHTPTRMDYRRFQQQLIAIQERLEEQPPRRTTGSPEQFGELHHIWQRRSRALMWELLKFQAVLMLLQVALIAALYVLEQSGAPAFTSVLLWGPFTLVNGWLLLQNWLVYIYEVGVRRDRIKAGIGLAIVGFGIVSPLTDLLRPMPREAAANAHAPVAAKLVDKAAASALSQEDQAILAEEDRTLPNTGTSN